MALIYPVYPRLFNSLSLLCLYNTAGTATYEGVIFEEPSVLCKSFLLLWLRI